MTAIDPRIIVPYADFLEHRERRKATTAAVQQPAVRDTIDAKAVSIVVEISVPGDPVATPLAQQEAHVSEGHSPAQT